MLFIVSCLILLAGRALCLPTANQYMDNILYTTLQNIILNEKYDPINLPDYTFEYTDKTFGGNVHGKAEYKQGSLKGLSLISRIGDCEGPVNTSDSTIINCTLTFHFLKTSYRGNVKYGVLPQVSIEAKSEISATSVAVGISKHFKETTASVTSFAIRQFGQVTPHYTGLGLLNKYVKVLEKDHRGKVTNEVSHMIENIFQVALNLAVNRVSIPLNEIGCC